jgi:hypothetical protein
MLQLQSYTHHIFHPLSLCMPALQTRLVMLYLQK